MKDTRIEEVNFSFGIVSVQNPTRVRGASIKDYEGDEKNKFCSSHGTNGYRTIVPHKRGSLREYRLRRWTMLAPNYGVRPTRENVDDAGCERVAVMFTRSRKEFSLFRCPGLVDVVSLASRHWSNRCLLSTNSHKKSLSISAFEARKKKTAE